MGEFALLGSEIVYDAREKFQLIRKRLKKTYNLHKSYSNNRKRDIEFKVGDWVYFKILPMQQVMMF